MHEETPCEFNHTLVKVTTRLLDVYMLTACEDWHPKEAATACRQFLLLYKSLNQQAEA